VAAAPRVGCGCWEAGGDVIFEFHPGRGKEFFAQDLLVRLHKGYLQRDGYGVSGALPERIAANPGLVLWAHGAAQVR